MGWRRILKVNNRMIRNKIIRIKIRKKYRYLRKERKNRRKLPGLLRSWPIILTRGKYWTKGRKNSTSNRTRIYRRVRTIFLWIFSI